MPELETTTPSPIDRFADLTPEERKDLADFTIAAYKENPNQWQEMEDRKNADPDVIAQREHSERMRKLDRELSHSALGYQGAEPPSTWERMVAKDPSILLDISDITEAMARKEPDALWVQDYRKRQAEKTPEEAAAAADLSLYRTLDRLGKKGY